MMSATLVGIAWVGVAFAQEPPAVAPPADAVAPAPAAVLWASQQVTVGWRHVPVVGEVASRTTVATLARVVPDGDGWLIVDRPCQIAVRADHGVELVFDPAAVRNMPPITFRFTPTATGFAAGPWAGGWGAEDVDGDGVGGIRVRVSAPVCGGAIDVASRTVSVATGSAGVGGGLSGQISVSITRDILGTSNACLSLLDRHTEEQVKGAFAWVPVPDGSTCDSLSAAAWPAQAGDPGVVDPGGAAR